MYRQNIKKHTYEITLFVTAGASFCSGILEAGWFAVKLSAGISWFQARPSKGTPSPAFKDV